MAADPSSLRRRTQCEYSTSHGRIFGVFSRERGAMLRALQDAWRPNQTMKSQTETAAVSVALVDDEFDHEFQAFIASIAVTEEELAAIVNMPDYSIPQVKEYLRTGELTEDAVCSASSISRPQLRRPARSREQHSTRQRAGMPMGAPLGRDAPGARAAGRVLHSVPKGLVSPANALPER
jgi:hypothetical protein